MSADNACLICAEENLKPLISIPDVPTLCNRLCASEGEAVGAPRGHISLLYCESCGHIANAAFDPTLVNYDGRFENSLSFSPHYRQYADATATRVINRYGLSDKRVVEIGCGSGDFLGLLCNAGNYGEGYDPSQRTRRFPSGRGSVDIIGRNFAIEDARVADFVCCRHVLEHLVEPVDLLRQLRKSMAKDNAIIFFEVPNGLYTLERLGIWDIIHEHISYFTPSSLIRAFQEAGFAARHTEPAFDDQYLWIEASVDDRPAEAPPTPPPDELYKSFGERFNEKLSLWRRRIQQLRSDNKSVVVWGGGAKGVMFLNLLGVNAAAGIDWVVDINPRKQGHFIPLTAQKIVGPEHLTRDPPDLVIVMNSEYEREIKATLDDIGIACEVESA